MYQSNRVAVVMPIHDEAEHIEKAITRVPDYVDVIVAVDDGSTDGTWERLCKIREPRLIRLRHEVNCGVGAATKTGYLYCLSRRIDLIAVMDGDGQMDGRDLASLLELLISGADYVKGNRFLHSETIDCMPRIRYVANRLLSWLSGRAEGFAGSLDAQCGYTAIRRASLNRIPLDRLYDRYGFPNEMFFAARRANLVVGCVPVRTIYGNERSGVNPFTAVPVIVWLIARNYARRRFAASLGRSGLSPIANLESGSTPATESTIGADRNACSNY